MTHGRRELMQGEPHTKDISVILSLSGAINRSRAAEEEQAWEGRATV